MQSMGYPVGLANPNISEEDQYKILMQSAVDRILPVYEKMLYDSNNRMNETLQIFRAIRLFNYEFVASTNALALGNEWHQFNKIPKALPTLWMK